jgi:hypothetical protein
MWEQETEIRQLARLQSSPFWVGPLPEYDDPDDLLRLVREWAWRSGAEEGCVVVVREAEGWRWRWRRRQGDPELTEAEAWIGAVNQVVPQKRIQQFLAALLEYEPAALVFRHVDIDGSTVFVDCDQSLFSLVLAYDGEDALFWISGDWSKLPVEQQEKLRQSYELTVEGDSFGVDLSYQCQDPKNAIEILSGFLRTIGVSDVA